MGYRPSKPAEDIYDDDTLAFTVRNGLNSSPKPNRHTVKLCPERNLSLSIGPYDSRMEYDGRYNREGHPALKPIRKA